MKGRYRLVHATADELGPFAEGLGRLEAQMTYPLDEGAERFRIDHGPAYHPFFSQMGPSHFLVALCGEEVVGNLVAVRRTIEVMGAQEAAFYMCDYKIAPEHRGGELSGRFWAAALRRLAVDRRLWGWRLAYGAAMRGERGDVSRSLRGAHPGRLFEPAARLSLYFTPPEALAALDLSGAPPPPRLDVGLDLSAGAGAGCDPPGAASTAGRKDLRLESTGAPWPLWHLPTGPRGWGASLGAHLKATAAGLAGRAGLACFAIDARLDDQRRWLASRGIEPGAVCTIYILGWPGRWRRASWVHIATSEI